MTRPTLKESRARHVDQWVGVSVAARIVMEVHGRHYRYHRAIGRELFESVGRSLSKLLNYSMVERICYANRENTAVRAEIVAFLARLWIDIPDSGAFLKLP